MAINNNMELKELLALQNPWWGSGVVPKDRLGAFRREQIVVLLDEAKKSPKITGLVGPRRAGKTTLLMETISWLIGQGVPAERLGYAQFETKTLCKEGAISEILEFVSERIGEPYNNFSGKVYLFLDEVHHLDSWAEEVKQLYELKLNVKFFISGSSSLKILKGAGESLLGRINHHIILPLSFREIVSDTTGMAITTRGGMDLQSAKGMESELSGRIPEIRLLLGKYMHRGGYPEIQDEKSIEKVFRTLNDYKDLALQRDIFEEEEIRDVKNIKELLEVLAGVAGSRTNYSKLASGLNIKLDTVKKYSGLFEDIFFTKELKVFSKKTDYSVRKERKVHFVDNGMLNAINMKYAIDSEYEGKAAENLVLSALLKKLYEETIAPPCFYWADEQGNEVDFVAVLKGELLPIEVKYREDPKTAIGLLNFMERFKVRRGIVITKNVLREETVKEGTVLYIPMWLFLLMF